MPDPDEFDRIVERLDLDLSFPEQEPAAPEHRPQAEGERWARSPDVESDAGDDAFYRRVDPGEPRAWHVPTALAWIGVAGGPLLLVVCTLVGFFMPHTVLIGLTMVFVASALYLISRLPSHRDDGDDGAVL